jgi:hypothetical protein
MSFDMKYDKNGTPIKQDQTMYTLHEEHQLAGQEEQVEQEVIESSTEVEQEQVEKQVAPQPQRSDPQESFRALRAKADRIERERDEAMRRLQEMEAARNFTQQTEQNNEDDDINIAPDDLAEGKHLSKVAKRIKKLETELNQYKQQSNQTNTETRLKAQYPDFDKVVSRDNIELLKAQYPEIAQTLHASTDLYSTAVSAYTLIKRLGIHQDDTFVAEKAIAIKNSAKPRPLASVSPQQGDSPLSRANAFANGLTDELKEQLRKEMFSARNNM